MQKNSRDNKRLIALVLIAVLLLGGAGFAVKTVVDRNRSQQTDLPEVVIVDETDSTQEIAQADPAPTESAAPTEETSEMAENSGGGNNSSTDGLKPAGSGKAVADATVGAKIPGSHPFADSSSEDSGSSDSGSDNSGSGNKSEYTVTFQTLGGSNIASKTVKRGTKISSLPTPYRDGYIFVSWYYNKGLTDSVASGDTVNRDLTLYADYAPQADLSTIENITFTSATDVNGSDFTIRITTDNADLDATTVLAGITAKNLTDPALAKDDIITVTGGNGSFLVSGKTSAVENGSNVERKGFAEGSTYQIALDDTRLKFDGQEDTVREYNFTTSKAEVLNASLKDDIIFLPVSELKNITNDGVSVSTLSIALYQADKSGVLGPADLTEGTFEYSGDQNLAIGDIVSVYAGLRPDLRTLDTPEEQNGDVAYVEITAKNGQKYSYKNAAPEDVIFEPDMLPVPADADQDGDADNNSITVSNDVLDYSGDIYANIDLDSQTTVDSGDFLMFYTGDFTVQSGENAAVLQSYAEIQTVTKNADDTTTITYEIVSWDEVQETMAIYAKEQMTGEEMIDGVDVQALEAQIEKQAVESGFAEEAAQYLGSLALATDNFTALSDNINVENYSVTLSDGSPISTQALQRAASGSGVKVECEMELGYPKAKISTHPTHFADAAGSAARDNGLSVALEVQAKITISKGGSDNQLEITVSGTFTEEVGMDLSVSSKAIWKVWGIFPYIAEYRVTANIDVLNYTNVSINATMVTKEESNEIEEGLDVAEQIKQMLQDIQNGEDEDKAETSSNLVKRYSEMLQTDSDWIRVIEQSIVDKEKQLPPAFPIIAVNLQVNFVVNMDACVSVGFDFEYLSGKRYTYTIDVFAHRVYNDTVSLLEERYTFDFYAMGRLGIKAGLEFQFNVGLFSTKLDSVGFRAEAGAYTKLWGYFYYELHYTASTGRTQQYSGALLIDVGAYLDVALTAQVLNGKYSTELTLYDNEWSLWTAGRQDNVIDFTTPQADMPEVTLKQYIRQAVIPDSVFSMHYLDLKTGEERDVTYDEQTFDIRMTNDKFTYDPQTNTIMVNPEQGDKKLTGEMIITWVQSPLAFTSRPVQRRISLYWDNVKDGYVIVPYTNGGSYIPIINLKYEAKVTQPADPVKPGYVFAGWYKDEELTEEYTFPEIMPAEDTDIYAKWVAATDTPYRVEHYKEQLLSGSYELADTEEMQGTTGEYVTCDVKSYTGYTSPALQEVKILPDGSAVLRYYYPLEWHTVTFDPGEVGGEKVSFDLKYGGTIVAPQMAVKGYTFKGWDKDIVPNMGTEDVVYTAQWAKNKDTGYRVEYYVQNANGVYKLDRCLEYEAFTGTYITADSLRENVLDNGKTAEAVYTAEVGMSYGRMTVRGEELDSVRVAGDGSTVIKIYYKRQTYKVTLDYGYDVEKTEREVYIGGEIVLPVQVERPGYTFIGWSLDGTNVVSGKQIMGTEDVTYTALWTTNTYTVTFNKGSSDATGTMQSMNFTYDEAQKLTANAFTRTGYDFAGWALQQGDKAEYADEASVQNLTTVDKGKVTLYAVWTPIEYTITYEGVDEDFAPEATTYTIQSDNIILTIPARTGYVFAGWYTSETYSGKPVTTLEKGSIGDRTFYAKWNPKTDTPYKVEHYQQNVGEGYTLIDSESFTGTTGSEVTPEVREYTGFKSPEKQKVTIQADGSTVVRYEYDRIEYTLTFDAAGGTISGDAQITMVYGASITLPIATRPGYGFAGWYDGSSRFSDSTMPAENKKLTAKWTAGEYGYTVNHYKQSLDGDYVLEHSVSGTSVMDSTVTPEVMKYEGFTAPGTQELKIGADAAENIVNYYYTRNKYQLSWDLAGGTAEGYTEGEVAYEAAIIVPEPVKTGYSYTWNETPKLQMPAKDLSYTAIWTPKEYTVTYVTNGGVAESEITTKTVTYDAAYGELPVLTKKNYTFDGWYTAAAGGTQVTAETIVTTAENHSLYAHFTPVSYKITYHGIEDAKNPNPAEYTIETGTILLKAASKPGYTLEGWYADETLSGDKITSIAGGSTGDIELYAKWQENSYTVFFHIGNDSETIEQQYTYTEEKELEKNPLTREGYSFEGWALTADGEPEYADGDKVSKLTGEADGEVHLYAVWKAIIYKITYANMEGAENAPDNPDEFTSDNNTIALENPTKTGYTFEGWYTDAELTNQVTGAFTISAHYDWTFYAKWTPNQYAVVFDSCLGIEVPTETQMMTYDKSANLTLVSEMKNFTTLGYHFGGWSIEKGGSAVYEDGANVTNLATEGNVYLYAVWVLDRYTITYDLAKYGISNSNPTSHTIEDEDIKLEDPEAEAGFEFLGWYDENGTKITEILKTSLKDYKLTAKWAHGGYFQLVDLNIGYSCTDTTGKAGSDRSFRIVRTFPEGVEPTKNTIYVYYRTVNGTAYGSTLSISEAGDTFHFEQKGGEGVYATFAPNTTQCVFSVREWGTETMDNPAAAFEMNYNYYSSLGTHKYYVELYKVVDTKGRALGSIDESMNRRTRILDKSSYLMTDINKWYGSDNLTANDFTVGGREIFNNTVDAIDDVPTWQSVMAKYEESLPTLTKQYMKDHRTAVGFYMKPYMMIGVSDTTGEAILRIRTPEKILGEYVLDYEDGSSSTFSGYKDLAFPNKTGAAGRLVTIKEARNTDSVEEETDPIYVKAGLNDTLQVEGYATGKWAYVAQKGNVYYKMLDEKAPEQVGIANLAMTKYRAGDTISLTVIYDEVLGGVGDDVTLAAIEGLPIKDVQVVTDFGTNALNFTATVTEDFTVTPDLNTQLWNTKPVIGTVMDTYGNATAAAE